MEARSRHTFKKAEKLKSRKTIEALFKTGKSFSSFPFRVLYQVSDMSLHPLQAGFAVSSKHFKKAVNRNRIKRLMREAYRLQKNELLDQVKNQNKQLAVFIIYTGNEMPDHSLIFDKTKQVLNRLRKLINENNPTNN